MAIERNGKHWCEPAAETPDEHGRYSCPCGKVWTYDADERLWSPYVEPKPKPKPGDDVAATPKNEGAE